VSVIMKRNDLDSTSPCLYQFERMAVHSATSAAATAEASAAKRAKPAPPASGAAAPDNQRLIDLNLLRYAFRWSSEIILG